MLSRRLVSASFHKQAAHTIVAVASRISGKPGYFCDFLPRFVKADDTRPVQSFWVWLFHFAASMTMTLQPPAARSPLNLS
jgi:hypothetical protein